MKPTVAVGGGVDYARPNPRIFPREAAWNASWDASINVNWPLFDGGRTRADIAETAAASARAPRSGWRTSTPRWRSRCGSGCATSSQRRRHRRGDRCRAKRRRGAPRRRRAVRRGRRDEHGCARRAGRAAAGRTRSDPGAGERAARRGAPRAGARTMSSGLTRDRCRTVVRTSRAASATSWPSIT